MNDVTKGKLVIVLLVSLIALGCGTACGIHTTSTSVNNTTHVSSDESENIQLETNNTSETVETSDDDDENNYYYESNNDMKNTTTNTNNKTINNTTEDTNNTPYNNTIEKDNSTTYNEDINYTNSDNSNKDTEKSFVKKDVESDEYFTNDSNLITKIEKITTDHETTNE